MLIGVICEGKTDFPVIKNVVQACLGDNYFEIQPLQPSNMVYLDNSDGTMTDKGWSEAGWKMMINFFKTLEFRKGLDRYDYLIIQIDTDIFGQKELEIEAPDFSKDDISDFYQKFENKIMAWIKENYDNFNEIHQRKIIFCICIHSIEYWLQVYRFPELAQQKHDCFERIRAKIGGQKGNLAKNSKNYDKFSQQLSDFDVLAETAKHSYSLNRFIRQIEELV